MMTLVSKLKHGASKTLNLADMSQQASREGKGEREKLNWWDKIFIVEMSSYTEKHNFLARKIPPEITLILSRLDGLIDTLMLLPGMVFTLSRCHIC